MLENLVDHLEDLANSYLRDSAMHHREGRPESASYWQGKAFAMNYASFLLEEELHNNA